MCILYKQTSSEVSRKCKRQGSHGKSLKSDFLVIIFGIHSEIFSCDELLAERVEKFC